MLNKLTVSVIIVTHNRSELLKNAVTSATEQTLNPNEIIVIDDYSDSNSAKINCVICKDKAKYIYLEEGQGAQFARNYGAKVANSEILCFLDDDDEFECNKIEIILNEFQKNLSVGAISNSFFVDKNKKKKKIIQTVIHNDIDELLSDNLLGGCSMMSIRKSVFNEVGGFSEELKSCQDWDMWLKVFLASNIICIKVPLTRYTIIPGFRITTNILKSYFGRRKLYFKYRKYMSEETRIWNLFIIRVFYYCITKRVSDLKKSIVLLCKTKRYIKGSIVLAHIFKRIVLARK